MREHAMMKQSGKLLNRSDDREIKRKKERMEQNSVVLFLIANTVKSIHKLKKPMQSEWNAMKKISSYTNVVYLKLNGGTPLKVREGQRDYDGNGGNRMRIPLLCYHRTGDMFEW